MKIPIVTDTHFGRKNDHPLLREYFAAFFKDQFFPFIDSMETKPTEIIHLGDYLDRRKYVNFETLDIAKSCFLSPLRDRGIRVHMVVGNHDVYFKNKNDLNSPDQLFAEYTNVKVYKDVQDVEIGNTNFCVIPWINPENAERSLSGIKESKATLAMGHLEIAGFQVMRGVPSEEGIDRKTFAKFEKILSGHFHQKHDDGHIFYLGTPYDMDRSDVNETKGFHVFDTSNRKLEFIENSKKLFHELVYDDSVTGKLTSVPDFTKYKNSYVQIVVKNRKHPRIFDRYLSELEDVGLASSPKIIDESELVTVDSVVDVDSTQDTLSIIFKEIDAIEDIENPTKLKKIMSDLYTESFNIDE